MENQQLLLEILLKELKLLKHCSDKMQPALGEAENLLRISFAKYITTKDFLMP